MIKYSFNIIIWQVDAKVALEFHGLRNSYPHWFQSQFGNKLLYTGFGALDIVGGDPLHLSTKLKVECDGFDVPLPKNAEGILIINIPSYMVRRTDLTVRHINVNEHVLVEYY